jgi:hypothetical protein
MANARRRYGPSVHSGRFATTASDARPSQPAQRFTGRATASSPRPQRIRPVMADASFTSPERRASRLEELDQASASVGVRLESSALMSNFAIRPMSMTLVHEFTPVRAVLRRSRVLRLWRSWPACSGIPSRPGPGLSRDARSRVLWHGRPGASAGAATSRVALPGQPSTRLIARATWQT